MYIVLIEMEKNPFSGKKVKMVPLKNVVIEETYTLTINYEKISGEFVNDYDAILKAWDRSVGHIEGLDYVMYPEFSDSGRLHFHGNITFKTALAVALFYESLFKSSKVFALEVDTIADAEVWSVYENKCELYMKSICERWRRKYKVTPKTARTTRDKSDTVPYNYF